jgi:diaminopimelate epimerase
MRSSRWHALGNSYLLLEDAELTSERVRELVGDADGILAVRVTGPDTADLTIWNRDGSQAELSGNGTRIAARWLAERNGVDRVRLAVGPRVVEAVMLDDGRVETDLGEVEAFERERVAGLEVTPVSVGNPHAVVEGDPDDLPLIGPLLETHPRFPERTNVQVARLERPGEIVARVWERGVGETTASGTSAVAVAAALHQNPAQVRFLGGVLEVRFEGRRAVVIGPAERSEVAVTPLQRQIMKLLVDDEATPLSELEGTMEAMFEYSSRAEARERVREALTYLIDRGLAQLVYYDPPFRWENRVPIPPAAAGALLSDPVSWVSPLERVDSRQVRAASTKIGDELFF